MVRTQPNAQVHSVVSALVVLAGLYLDVSFGDWAILGLAMGAVWTTEALNTALEFAIDLLHPDWHPLAGTVKDVAAGAVLLATVFAVATGIAVFLPHIRTLWTELPQVG